MSYLRFFVLCGLILFQVSLCAQDSTRTIAKVLAKAGDTLADLNDLNRGILEFQVDLGDSTWYQMGAQGQLILAKDVVEGDRLPRLEIKTKTAENEFYENRIQVHTQDATLTVHVSSDKIEMATGLRANGKIWVVIAVVFVLFFTLIGLLLYQQQSLRKWEKTQTKT